ncbi:hypothetical protein SO802_026435 [Lithocarpus litseifolius]|uniref:DUF7746 domain-containing protein n=1 Tax=Lithocarpus litseifolius TaxID=425828 RepID=A0AAW2C300_9ROSI
MHEGASSNQEAVSLQEYATVAHSSGNTVITLQETPTPIYSSGNPVVDVLNYTLEENLAKDSYGINSNFPYPTKTILDLLQSAFILDNDHLFQRTLKTLKNHLDNLEARNVHLTSLLSGKEQIRSKDMTVLMGTCFARLSLKTQASVRSAFANLPSEYKYYDPDSPDLDYTTNLNYTAENALTVSRWEAYFGSSLRVYEREKHPFLGLLINYNDLLEDEEEDNQMNPHWLSQMFEYGFVRLIRLTSHNQVSQLPAIIRDTVTRVLSPYVTIRCWSTLPEWEMNHWATVQPSKHLVLLGGYSHQGPWFEGNTFLSYGNPKALADCWRSFFSNEIRKVSQELWKNYHFVGSTGRISVFTGRPYYESIPRLPWTTHCDPRQFLTPGQNPDFEPTSSDDDKEIEHVQSQFQDLDVKRLYQPPSTSLTKNWYPRPTPPDLQYEERNVNNQFSVTSGKLYEWNIDGLSEQEILNKIQHIAMVANNYLNEGKTHPEVIDLIVLGFTGKLLQWWNNCLTEHSKEDIKTAVQKNEEGLPIFEDPSGRGIPDGVNTLIYTIINHFVGKPSNITSRIYDQLSNLRCRTLGDYRWYEDVFTTRVMNRSDCNSPFWKEKFINGLPTLFGEKVKETLCNSLGEIDYDNLTYGDISSTIRSVGMKMCRDFKIHSKASKSKAKYELGTFCTQYGLPPIAPSKRKSKHRRPESPEKPY